jgi:membrane-associated phospholipid phosphatase
VKAEEDRGWLRAMLSALVVGLVMSQTPQKLRWDPRIDLPVSGALVAGWLLSETVLKKPLAPAECRWCATNTFDTAVRSTFFPQLLPSAEGQRDFHVASNVLGLVALPLAVLGLDALYSLRDGVFLEAFPIDVVLIVETVFAAQNVNQITKFAVGRARPFTIGATPELLANASDPADANLSFFSGHSMFAFAAVASGATIAKLRGYRLWWLTWVVGLPMAATTAIFRLAADKHWATDVLLGSALGVAAGVLMPTFLHGSVGPLQARVVPAGTGLAVTGTF